MSVGIFAAHEAQPVAQRGDPLGDELLELGLDAVLREAGVVAEFDRVVVHDLVQLDGEALAPGVRRHEHAVVLPDRARRAHPVERLVGLRVRVHRDRTVGFQYDQPHRTRQPRAEPSLVLDGTVRDEHPHARVRYRPIRRPVGGFGMGTNPDVSLAGR